MILIIPARLADTVQKTTFQMIDDAGVGERRTPDANRLAGSTLMRVKKRMLSELFGLNHRLMKAYLAKESLDRLWNYS